MSGGVGLLLLVEAELSNPMYELDTGDYDAEAKAKKHNAIATKGVGQTVPIKWKDAGCINDDLEGILMVSETIRYPAFAQRTVRCRSANEYLCCQPDGKPGANPHHKGGYLQYNEYISYHVEHLKLRYLFKVAM